MQGKDSACHWRMLSALRLVGNTDLAVGCEKVFAFASRSMLLGRKSYLIYTLNLHQITLLAMFFILESHL